MDQSDPNLALPRKLDTISNQVDQDLRQAGRVPPKWRRPILNVYEQLKPTLSCLGQQDGSNVLKDIRHGKGYSLELQFSRFDTRKVEHVAHDREKMSARVSDRLYVADMLFRQILSSQEIRHAKESSQRGPDFVTHCGKEVVLRVLRSLSGGNVSVGEYFAARLERGPTHLDNPAVEGPLLLDSRFLIGEQLRLTCLPMCMKFSDTVVSSLVLMKEIERRSGRHTLR